MRKSFLKISLAIALLLVVSAETKSGEHYCVAGIMPKPTVLPADLPDAEYEEAPEEAASPLSVLLYI
ncbi:hypothetical protein [Flavihumibacter sp. ZG627]|uniref:hypothetical protein n=1 Tax=Flavihumibacter sp. ZG627 TaxID=1463156 RepID=UPI000580526B|nr:hypothetical protein [Flavihumibacter sp. ZG627]KIC90117.1 hypothetical protein HY58_12190 [Flavihumibacter sp. ZG627]